MVAPRLKDAKRLADLPEGWDSYDGIPPTEAALETAMSLVVVPMSNGGVQIESPAGEVGIEVSPEGRFVCICFGPCSD